MTVKDEVLKTLENNRSRHISGEEISEKIGVSRAAVWKAVKALREEGYNIEAVTNKGYAMAESGQLVSEELLCRALRPKLKRNGVFCYDSTDSTNLQAKRLMLEGEIRHGSVVFANRQTAGRGRLGRSFNSPEQGIYVSIVVKPDFDMSKSVLVTVAAAVAVADAIEAVCGQDAGIKWVNDIYIGDLKVCGILTEAETDFETGIIDSLIIGIGVNTSTAGFPAELKKIAGCVNAEDARTKADLTARITENTLANVAEISEGGQPGFMARYRSKSILIGREIMVYKGIYREDPTRELGGIPARVEGIDDEGGLMVAYEDGKRETLTSGEVSIRL